ncbi:MAG: hydrogenase iron-sulfur subunit, partial [Desulfofustis sp.]|nr:hydrogenase iron-sulfur subunit [Desulfofustis sp.]
MARSDMIVELLDDYGYEQDRFSINWVSSAEADKFVSAVSEMTDKIKKLGPVHSKAQP